MGLNAKLYFVYLNIVLSQCFFTAYFIFLCSYRPNLLVSYISGVLGFQSEEDCLAFLTAVEAVITSDGAAIDCKLTQAKLVAGSGS